MQWTGLTRPEKHIGPYPRLAGCHCELSEVQFLCYGTFYMLIGSTHEDHVDLYECSAF